VARRPSKKPLVELAAFETKIDCTKAYFRAQSRSMRGPKSDVARTPIQR
jgi:hypothetical protein